MAIDGKVRRLKLVPSIDKLPLVHEHKFEEWNAKTRTRDPKILEIPLTVHQTEQAAQRDLLSVLRLVDAGKVVVSDKTRRASASTIDAIKAILDRGDYYPQTVPKDKWSDESAGPIRAFAWPLLIQAGRLAQLSGTRLQLTEAGRRALSGPPASTIRSLWEKWKVTTIFDELSRIECVKGQTGKGKRGLAAVSKRREAIAASLTGCPAGEWIAIDDLFRYLLASGSGFEVTREPWSLYICELQYGSLGFDGGERILNERYILSLLLEYAATLGIIDVALIPPADARRNFRHMWGTDELPFFSRYDGLMYFRLTPLGEYCLGLESEWQHGPLDTSTILSVLPNLEIIAEGSDLEPGDRLALNAYATPFSDVVWRLETGKLLAAIESGRPVEEIRGFLTARSAEQLPDTVERLLDDAAQRASMVHDRGLVRLIECDDAALAEQIVNDKRTRKHCMRAGERHLVVVASSDTAFRRGLQESGYLLSIDKRPEKKSRRKPPATEG